MSRFKEIFSNKPEKMSNLAKWFFGLPIAYIAYLLISMILPGGSGNANSAIIAQALRSLVLVICVLDVSKWFVGIRAKKLCSENESFSSILFFKGFYVMLIALIVTNLCLYFIYPSGFAKNTLDAKTVWNWLCSLILVAVAAFTEEVIFRSYIAWFGKGDGKLSTGKKSIIIYAAVSAVLFTIAHFENPEVEKSALWSMLFYFVFGFSLMVCFFKTKGIEFGLGVHFANNLFAAWILNYNDSVLPTSSLYATSLPISFITVLQAVICLLFCTIMCPESNNKYEEK